MKKVIRSVLLTLILLAGLAIGFSSGVSADSDHAPGAVYAMTNNPTGNAVVMFNRDAAGKLENGKLHANQGNGQRERPGPIGFTRFSGANR